MKRNLFLTLAFIGLIGCGPVPPSVSENKSSAPPSAPVTESPSVAPTDSSRTTVLKPDTSALKADNTGVNERDRDTKTLTPLDQGENSRELKTTADIRKTILSTDGMSVNARNVKIITTGDKVTLRGPVSSQDEKDKIERIAKDVAGEGNVTSEIEVTQ